MDRNRRQGQQGFSLIELTVVMGLMSVMVVAAVLSTTSTRNNFRANSSMSQYVGQLRSARAQAIAQRREVQVTFGSTAFTWGTQDFIQLHRLERPTGVTDYLPAYIDRGVQPIVFPSLPDTPMAFGKSAAIYIGGQSGGPVTMKFTTTGAFVDAAGNPINGTIFLGLPGYTNTARAVTILGATGRIRQYHWNGQAWLE